MRGVRIHAFSASSSIANSSITVRRQHCSPMATGQSRRLGFDNGTSKHWDKFYKRHQNKFFKDRHYLEKDWGHYFNDDNSATSSGKVVLEVGCGAGNTIFPLVATYPKLFVHACDYSPRAIALVKSHVDFNEDQVNAFVCDVGNDDLCDRIMPSSIDVITLIFMLSAVCPKKMPLVLKNIKKVLKPYGYILLRDYAIGDYAQVELHKRNQVISENFYLRGDGTSAFYFSEECLSTLFMSAGFRTVDMDIYNRQIQNRSRNITMCRRWIRAAFSQFACGIP
ncbi:Methyltransferase-like protein [Actinidia chinensis var. chinensis]|uniref:tRNA N(3)-methylcytidine methyltransferase n=1 Tax=Actinidia chinensis var. chinensis TaxID=1590841 RepID=A0A2R6PSY5_ACTCC|nr:Methyltransferase-like protein [Actinidia chinensis var. chinensis]